MIGRHGRTSPLVRVLRSIAVVSTASSCVLLAAGLGAMSTSAAAPSGAPGAFSATEALTRTHLVNGADQVADRRAFGLTVSQTQRLRDRQEIDVSWTGAHPTGGVVGDHNSAGAAEQEYPVMLVECRGVDSLAVPVAQRISQRTCFTHTPAERFQSDYNFTFPPYRLDRYATPADRVASVGQPTPLPAACAGTDAGIQHWIGFDAVNGTSYPGGLLGCAGMPPEAVNNESQLQPTNTAYGVTDPSGNGSEKFTVATAETNASLGCSAQVPCSLVVVPIMGVSCDPAGAALPVADRPLPAVVATIALRRCAETGKYAPGERSPGTVGQEDAAVSGLLWWSASNWHNRISVPLDFAAASDVCSVASTGAPLYVYGSELMVQATQQWSPAFCLDPKRFRFQHVQAGEPQAKNLLGSGSIEAAFAGGPPETTFSRPTVQAPVALSGFAISYAIDDAHHQAYHSLKLTPRILAKLLSQSYPSDPDMRRTYPALSHNPIDLPSDPELRALNPDMPTAGYNTQPASTLFSLSSDSDVISALTAYINADPEARAFLDGQPDPWGMTVNPNYKSIALPVHGWPQLDTFEPAQKYRPDVNPCLALSPVPWLGQVAAPVSTLAALTLNLQFNLANSQIACANAGEQNQKLTSLGREVPGQRFLLGITSLGAAARYQLDQASLQTTVSSSAAVRFAGAAGRTFVGPTVASLRSAAALLTPDPATGTWLLPYRRLHADSAAATAYPGTMLLSMDVPTAGLPAADAVRYGELLRFAAGAGQQAGVQNGQLPDGYLPLTSANGAGQLVRYTQVAAGMVAAQNGHLPSVLDPEPLSVPTPAVAAAPAVVPADASVPVALPAGPDLASLVAALPQQPLVAPPVAAAAALRRPAVRIRLASGRTPTIGSGLGGLVLPMLLGLAGLTSICALLLLNTGSREQR